MTMSVPPIPKFQLNDGNKFPALLLGTFTGELSDDPNVAEQARKACCNAIDIGYRAFDTAYVYNTEPCLKQAVSQKMQEGVVNREDLFITTKLWNECHKKNTVLPALQNSLTNLGMDYVDLYLVHWPVAMKPSDALFSYDPERMIEFEDDDSPLVETWQGMEECVRQGLAKSIGVSNFNKRQLQLILSNCSIKPANNQIESSPLFTNVDLVKFCQSQDILVSCYAPLGMPTRTWDRVEGDPTIFSDQTVCEIAKKYNKTSAQVSLRFQYQRGCAVIPKSFNPERQKENINIFDFQLSEEDMSAIYKCNKNIRAYWLETFKPSKEYPFTED